jgi:hypothetical protein
MTSLFLFSILFNLFFSIYGYAFTYFPGEGVTPDLDIGLDPDSLYKIGMSFINGTSLNVTFNMAPVIIEEETGVPLRVRWESYLTGDLLEFEIQNPVERYLETWYAPLRLNLYMGPEYDHYTYLYNSTIVTLWEPEFNWTRGVGGSDFAFFLTTWPDDDNNITKAVYETGRLVLTYGEPISLTGEDEISIKNFIKWYYNTITGFNSYGLPSALVWFMRIIFTLNIIAGVFMLKELSRF